MTHACANCGAKNVERVILEAYNYNGLGLPIVVSRSVIRTSCATCEQQSHTIPDLGGLKAAVAVSIVADPSKLSGQQIKFLRKAMGLKAIEFAKRIDLAAETISRLENDKIDLSGPLELKLRMIVIDALHAKAPGIDIDISAFAKIASGARSPKPHTDTPVWFEQVKCKEYEHRVWDRDTTSDHNDLKAA